MFFYTYVLRSKKSDKLYVGFTADLRRRVMEHNTGLVTVTKPNRPWELVYYEACQSRQKAIQREKYLKTGFGRRFLKARM